MRPMVDNLGHPPYPANVATGAGEGARGCGVGAEDVNVGVGVDVEVAAGEATDVCDGCCYEFPQGNERSIPWQRCHYGIPHCRENRVDLQILLSQLS